MLCVTLGYGLVGFYDDYLKVTKRNRRQRRCRPHALQAEAVIAGVAWIALVELGQGPFSTSLTFPLFKEVVIQLGYFFLVFGMLVMMGASNAVNLTDGLDGLRSCRP